VSNERQLSAGTTLVRIGRWEDLEIEADVLSQDVVRVKAGQQVEVHGAAIGPRAATAQVDVPVHVADGATLALAPDQQLRKTTFKAGRKDSVASVARRYKVSAAQVAEWNDVAVTASFKRGQPVVVYRVASVASKSKRATRTKSASASKKKSSRVAAQSSGKNAGKHAAKAPVRSAKASKRTSTATVKLAATGSSAGSSTEPPTQ